MAQQLVGPLTDNDYKQINAYLEELAQLEPELALARSAGFQCDQHNAHCQALKARLAQIKAAYFPQRP